MSTTIKIDIIEGTTMRETQTGFELQRIARVSGLSGDASQRMFEALNADGMPRRLDSHPTVGGMRCDERAASVEQTSGTTARVTLTYRTVLLNSAQPKDPEVGDIPVLSYGTSLTTTTTQLDYAGATMALKYVPSQKEIDNGEMIAGDYPVLGTASVQVPQTFLRYKKRDTTDASGLSLTYVGTTNATPIFGKPAGTWLCSAINGETTDGGKTFVNTFEFQFARQKGIFGQDNIGWNVILVAEKDGKKRTGTVDELKADDGIDEFQVYPRTEFHNIGV